MTTEWEIKGKTFLISGGASGLGARYVEVFLQEGAKKVAILDVAEAVGQATAEKLNQSYPDSVIFIKCDVSDDAAQNHAFDQVLDNFGRIDVIINNAGIMSDAPRAWRKACDVNWQGLVSFTMKGLQHMRKDEGGDGGTIINISSTAALTVWPMLPIYSGAKMAVLHFTQCLAIGLPEESTGVRLMTMCFGPTDTPLMQGLSERTLDNKTGKVFDEVTKTMPPFQKVESAVSAFVEMYKKGTNGSIWLSTNDRPLEDFTPVIQKAFKDIESAWMF